MTEETTNYEDARPSSPEPSTREMAEYTGVTGSEGKTAVAPESLASEIDWSGACEKCRRTVVPPHTHEARQEPPVTAEAAKCPTCWGKGEVYEDEGAYLLMRPSKCTDCDGTGQARQESPVSESAAANPGFCPSCLKPEDYCICVVNNRGPHAFRAASPEPPTAEERGDPFARLFEDYTEEVARREAAEQALRESEEQRQRLETALETFVLKRWSAYDRPEGGGYCFECPGNVYGRNHKRHCNLIPMIAALAEARSTSSPEPAEEPPSSEGEWVRGDEFSNGADGPGCEWTRGEDAVWVPTSLEAHFSRAAEERAADWERRANAAADSAGRLLARAERAEAALMEAAGRFLGFASTMHYDTPMQAALIARAIETGVPLPDFWNDYIERVCAEKETVANVVAATRRALAALPSSESSEVEG